MLYFFVPLLNHNNVATIEQKQGNKLAQYGHEFVITEDVLYKKNLI